MAMPMRESTVSEICPRGKTARVPGGQMTAAGSSQGVWKHRREQKLREGEGEYAGRLGLWEGRSSAGHFGGAVCTGVGLWAAWKREGASKDYRRKGSSRGPGAKAEVREEGQL